MQLIAYRQTRIENISEHEISATANRQRKQTATYLLFQHLQSIDCHTRPLDPMGIIAPCPVSRRLLLPRDGFHYPQQVWRQQCLASGEPDEQTPSDQFRTVLPCHFRRAMPFHRRRIGAHQQHRRSIRRLQFRWSGPFALVKRIQKYLTWPT